MTLEPPANKLSAFSIFFFSCVVLSPPSKTRHSCHPPLLIRFVFHCFSIAFTFLIQKFRSAPFPSCFGKKPAGVCVMPSPSLSPARGSVALTPRDSSVLLHKNLGL